MGYEIETNIDELVKTIRSDIQGMFGSDEMKEAGKNAYDIMFKNVKNRMKTTGYDYYQSGDFSEAMDDERNNYDRNDFSKNSMNVGFGFIGEGNNEGLSEPRWMRQEQNADFYVGHGYLGRKDGPKRWMFMRLKAETEMPKWIVLEFGTGGKGGNEEPPEQFKVGYTRKPEKDIMWGPSDGAPAGLRKHVYVMLSAESHARIGNGNWYQKGDEADFANEVNKHPGIRAGHFFQNGLADAKRPVYEALGVGLEKYLSRINGE